MRILPLTPLAFLVTGCLAPGERNPARYPWDQPTPAVAVPHPPIVARGAVPPVSTPLPPAVPPQGAYCVVSLEPPNASGITIGGNAPSISDCSMPIAPASRWKTGTRPTPQTSH